VSKRKKQQPIEEEAVDKLDQFLATNSKKLLGGLAVILVVFLAVYAFNTMNKSRSGAMANKAGQLELLMTMSGGEKQHLDNYLTIAVDYPKLADYVNLKAAEILVVGENTDAAKAPLASVSGDYAELAAGLKFDTGLGEVNAEQYIQSGKMTALWYYRACLAAEGAEKDKLIAEFKEKYPENELYKQIERWNG
jgi:predicted negative regulator of RcsB-dependent stress response